MRARWRVTVEFLCVADPPAIGPLLGLSLIHISEPTRLLSISYAVFGDEDPVEESLLHATPYDVIGFAVCIVTGGCEGDGIFDVALDSFSGVLRHGESTLGIAPWLVDVPDSRLWTRHSTKTMFQQTP